MTEMFLEATPRTGTGKSVTRKIRQQGKTPGVVYGLKEPTSITVEARALGRIVQHLHGAERLISLKLGDENKNVLIKEVQTEAVGNFALHVDFQEIDLSKKVHVTVEVRGVGQSNGVRLGGILQTVRHEVTIECLPISIPEYIDADISGLELGYSFHVSDLVMPEGIRVLTEPEETLFVVTLPRTAAEEEAAEGAEAEAAAAAAEPAKETPEDSE